MIKTSARLELRHWRYRLQIRLGSFISPEPEFRTAATRFLRPGAVAIDVGANVGHYTRDFARVVGPMGRVYCFEPIPETFALLAGNTRELANVTLLNMAASDSSSLVGMTVPSANFYRANITADGEYKIATMPIDALNLATLHLLKIDAEGHEPAVLRGAEATIRRCLPAIILETPSDETLDWVRAFGYEFEHTETSPNVVAVPTAEGLARRHDGPHLVRTG